MRSMVALVLMAFLLIAWFPTGVCAEELKLEKAVMCVDVKDRMPVGEAKEFPSSTKKVFCFTIIEGAKEPSQIMHVWQFKGNKVGEITLPIKTIKWRTWSTKNILPTQVGPWAVDIVDTASKKVIGTVQFTIK